MSQPLRVLQVEDSEIDAALVVRVLRTAGYDVVAERVETAAEMRAALARESFHLILADCQLPQFNAPDALAVLQEIGQDLPFIVVSGMIGEDAAVAMMKGGAHDYVMKDRLTRLAPAVERELGEAQGRRERRAAEQALRESEDRFRTFFLKAPIGVVLEDAETRFIDVNEAFCRMLGYGRDELLGLSLAELTHPEDREQLLAMSEAVAQGGTPGYRVERRCLKKDGGIQWVSTTSAAIRAPDGSFLYRIRMVEDITERRQIERRNLEALEALRDGEERFRGVFQGVTDGILLAEIESGAFVMANPAICEMLGYSEQELLGLGLKDVHPAEHVAALSEVFSRQVEGDQVLAPGVVVQRKDGSTFIADISSVPILLAGRRCLMGVFRDMTAVNGLEQQLRQAQKMEAVGRLAGGVAHDFNNALGVILGHTEVLMRHAGEAQRGKLEQILKATQRASGLTRQLLAFSRKHVVDPKVLDINALLSNLEKMLGRLIGEDIDLAIVPGADLGRVKADPGQLEQVVMNLCVNARDAMPDGGMLRIETANAQLDAGHPAPEPSAPGRYVMLAVSDAGCGIEKEILSKIFEPFFTTKKEGKGTGLGLAMVYGIVKQAGGHVWAYSEVGRGTSVKVYLPRIDEAAVEPEVRETPVLARGWETILLVEDEAPLRVIAREILEEHGYRVIEATCPNEAIEIVHRHPEPIHLLVTDVVMPGMNGRALAESLVAARPELRVLYMSGYTDDVLAHSGVLESGTLLLEKPFTTLALLGRVRAALGERGTGENA